MEIEAGGETLKAREESFTSSNEEWSEYKLESGTTVRARVTVLKIFRVLDEEGNPKFLAGEPHVIVRHQVLIVASDGPEPQIVKEMHEA